MAPPPAAAAPDALDVNAVAHVLTEFCQSDYARQACQYCNIAPSEYGKIQGMFKSVRLDETRLVVKLHRSFEQRSAQLLDRLAKHLRARMPQLTRLIYEKSSPPSVSTIILSS